MTKPQILNLLERVMCAISPVIPGLFQMRSKCQNDMQNIVLLLIFLKKFTLFLIIKKKHKTSAYCNLNLYYFLKTSHNTFQLSVQCFVRETRDLSVFLRTDMRSTDILAVHAGNHGNRRHCKRLVLVHTGSSILCRVRLPCLCRLQWCNRKCKRLFKVRENCW